MIAVSAQQRATYNLNAKTKWIRGRFFVVFSSVDCIGSLLIHLSFIRFNVVVVIGQDGIEVWSTSSTTDWNSNRLSYQTSFEQEDISLPDQAEETAVMPN